MSTKGLEEAEQRLAKLEAYLHEKPTDSIVTQKLLARVLTSRLDCSESDLTLEKAIDSIAKAEIGQFPFEATALIRCLGLEDMKATLSDSSIHRPILSIIEKWCPEVCREVALGERRQTYEKMEIALTIHMQVERELAPFLALTADLDLVINARPMLSRSLHSRLVKSYSAPIKWAEIRAGFELIMTNLAKLPKDKSVTAKQISDCRKIIEEQIGYSEKHMTFLSQGYYKVFLVTSLQALDNFFSSVRGQMVATIRPRLTEQGVLQKRYPFREVGRTARIAIPLRNEGPGTALDVSVRVEVDAEKLIFQNDEVRIGSVLAGDFSPVLDCEVMNESDSIEFLIEVSWGEEGSHDRNRMEFIATANAQRCDIDWSAQTYRRPYSTEVAKGETFVGRRDKVQRLASKMLRSPMESFYVTGQKRVGKTSLALAAAEFAKYKSEKIEINYKYILWGTIANSDPAISLRSLGELISEFILDRLPNARSFSDVKFDGSIAPLIQIAEYAEKISPDSKFIIMIDEFDEIHPELYQKGNLAEAFFANIRALSNCDNVCICLIGGENMPFIMDRQGQKLNKLVREPLDYFSRADEWDDFRVMVTSPSEGILEWHEDAISEVFNSTNGNPFFAKIVCGAVFDAAVHGRDADVTINEVRNALAGHVPTFDTNAFSHLWQDGIHRPVDEREPDVLLRCRVLVLLARAARKGLPITLENLLTQKHGLVLSDSEIVPVLNSFVRRTVLRELHGRYEFVLPIFRAWLTEIGGSRLIADTLGEELAESVRSAEDEAFVRSDEITQMVGGWPTYQGREISADLVRAWFEQIDGLRNQRLIFKILKNIRFVSDSEVREILKTLHGLIRPSLPEFVIRRRSERREDVLITYADGQGKSGQYYASRYAEINNLAAKSIIAPFGFSEAVRVKIESGVTPSRILFVDDLIATGRALTRNLRQFITENETMLKQLNVKLTVVALIVTAHGEETVRRIADEFEWIDLELRYGEVLDERHFAFGAGLGFWDNDDERARAKSICEDIGAKIYRDNPLGFGGFGLLLVFPTNCPNNSLPILHSRSRNETSHEWEPLFPRYVH